MRGYQATISAATGIKDAALLASIEETMRQDIFHSTLDWQTRPQLEAAAREAYGLIRIRRRGGSPLVLPEDAETAALLGVYASDIPALAAEVNP